MIFKRLRLRKKAKVTLQHRCREISSRGFAAQSCKKTHGFVMIFATSTMPGDLAKIHAKTF
jgi:hypothetical protein